MTKEGGATLICELRLEDERNCTHLLRKRMIPPVDRNGQCLYLFVVLDWPAGDHGLYSEFLRFAGAGDLEDEDRCR
jgi:hypothetical protein